jgi:hypothetical protein
MKMREESENLILWFLAIQLDVPSSYSELSGILTVAENLKANFEANKFDFILPLVYCLSILLFLKQMHFL